MEDYSNITGGLKIASQIPLDVKTFVLNENTLSYLGADDNLAFTYYDNLKVFCSEERTTYEWREVGLSEQNTGLIASDFLYPSNSISFGIDYSGKYFNFFKVETVDFLIQNSITSIGNGEEIYNGFNEFTEKHEIKSIKSSTLSVDTIDGTLFIEQPSTSTIPALYVNNLYIPTEEEFLNGNTKGYGTLAKPFTNTVTAYTSGTPTITPDTAIQNALDNYIGTGTVLAPQKAGQQIKVQDNVIGYSFTGNFNINQFNIVLEENVIIYSNPLIGDFLVDYDALPSTQALSMSVNLKNGAKIVLIKSGFRNSGTLTNSGAYATRKLIDISGEGQIAQSSTSIDSNIYTIFQSNYTTSNNYHNDSSQCIIVKGITISTITQSIYSIGGNSKVDFSDVVLSINGATSLPSTTEFFNQKGGIISISNSAISVTPFFGIQIDNTFPISKFVGIPSTLIISNTLLSGGMETIFKNETSLQSTVIITNLTNVDFASINIAKSPSVVWTLFVPNNNILYNSGNIDNTQIDLTGSNSRSHYNIFNGQIVETLSSYINKASAAGVGLTRGNKFINRKTVTAGAFVVGTEYQIVSTGGGSTNFTLIGAPNNTVGTYFTATGTPFTLVGTGTGTANLETIEIL